MQCTTNDWGYVWSSQPQTLRQALTLSMSFYIYQSAIGGAKEKQILVFVCIYGKQPTSWFIHFFGVWWWGFLQYRLNVKIHVQVHFTVASTILFFRIFSCIFAYSNYGFLCDGGKND